ncbi:transglycosylase domain-containing protein [uncultured Enterovirga sp.]|uniref:transglycosylase domain-containing protein n=1 Tax=uncultured Enterovirga sp. TaxID=2026352 RepID=UPI0035CA89FD
MGSALHAAGLALGRALRLLLAGLDEAVTLATVGALLLLTLAQPAFRETGPDWLKRLDLSATFLDRHGREIGRRGIRHDDRLALDDLPPHLVAAVLATEDRRFHDHHGIDPVGLVRALVANAQADGIVQGGSTITQQLAKNLFLSGERTLERKISEAFLAVWLEFRLGKAEILKLYLDRAYLGAGTFGVEAASRFYFEKSARDVTLAEAATLAGLFKAPSRYAPHASPAAAQARAGDVLDRMYDTGAIGRRERDAAKEAPAVAVARDEALHPDHYLDWAFREVQRLAGAGRFGAETVLVVETPLDGAIQRQAETSLRAALARDGQRFAVRQAAMVVMDPDGAVRAMVGGRDYGDSQFNRATDALRQPGSAFKPFVYAAALAYTSLRPNSLVQDAEICLGSWCPANYGRSFAGAMPLSSALARSINTVAVRLSVEIGRAAGETTTARQARFGRGRIIDVAQRLGLTTKLQDTPSLPLGASEVKLLDMTAAYAVFASGGVRVEPHAVVGVANARGTLLFRRDRDMPRPGRAIALDIVADMNSMLRKVVDEGTARRAAIPGHPSGGKTGTTSAYRDAWYVGFTGHLVGGVWFGNDDDRPTRQLTGGALPAALWHDVMAPAHRGLAPLPLPGLDSAGPRTAAQRERGFIEPAAAASGFSPVQGRRGFDVVSGSGRTGLR